jgi:hypothetical protein
MNDELEALADQVAVYTNPLTPDKPEDIMESLAVSKVIVRNGNGKHHFFANRKEAARFLIRLRSLRRTHRRRVKLEKG